MVDSIPAFLWYLSHGYMRSDSHDRVDVNVKVAAKLRIEEAPRLLQRMAWQWWYISTLQHKVRGCNEFSKSVHP